MFSCNICGKALKTRVGMKYHQERCTAERVKNETPDEATEGVHRCLYCAKNFRDSESLQMHIELTHASVRSGSSKSASETVICELCGESYYNDFILRLHQDREHLGKDLGERYEHVKLAPGDMPFCCGDCDKSYKSLQTVLNHIDAHHKEQKRLVCDQCTASFVKNSDLVKHLAQAHGAVPRACARPSGLRAK